MAVICHPDSEYSDHQDSDTHRYRSVPDQRRNANRMDSHRSLESYSSFPCNERKLLITDKDINL